MKIPKYVEDILGRSEFCFFVGSVCADAGYTITVHKASEYQMHRTLNAECDRLVAWANRQCPSIEDAPTARVDRYLTETHYCDQTAVVTIYDPVMKEIESMIHYDRRRR